MSRSCALCRRVFNLGHIRLAPLEQRDLELLQTLMDSTMGHPIEGSLAMEVNGIKALLQSAPNIGGIEGMLEIVRVLCTQIEVCQFVTTSTLLFSPLRGRV